MNRTILSPPITALPALRRPARARRFGRKMSICPPRSQGAQA
ncbi:MAG: hypothetical protein ACLTZY_02665 [Alistipes indistinctus]